MKIRCADLTNDSIVDGDGYRLTVFTQGCPHECPGCQNPQSWPAAGGKEMDTADILAKVLANPLLSGVTFSGGEPFLQPEPLADLAKKLHQSNLNIWIFTGYTLEELEAMPSPHIQELLAQADVLVDGRYEESLRDLTLHFRGSSNQRVIDMNKTRNARHIILKYTD